MMRKKFLACMLAVSMVATTAIVAIPTLSSEAAGLTQATTADEVKYGTLTKNDTEIIKSLFDFDYYKSQNPELVEVLGDNYNELFKHFCLCGIFEGRTCNPNFDPAAYASAYKDLKGAYGNDIMKYYQHYATVGVKENRTITTVAACAEAGITVETLTSSEVKITPAIYQLAQKIGTTEYVAIQNAVNRAATKAAKSVSANNTGTVATDNGSENVAVVVTNEPMSEAVAAAKGLEKVSSISLKDSEGILVESVWIYVYKGKTGYAAYEKNSKTAPSSLYSIGDDTLLYKTADYEAPNEWVKGNCIMSVYVNVVDLDYPTTSDGSYTSPAGEPAMKMTTEYPHGMELDIQGGEHKGKSDSMTYEVKEVSFDASSRTTLKYEVYGKYNSEGGVDEFSSEAEKKAYIEEYSANDTSFKSTYEYDLIYDGNGTRDTVYDIGFKLEEKDDNTVDVTIGLSNDETGVAAVRTLEYTESTIDEDDAEE